MPPAVWIKAVRCPCCGQRGVFVSDSGYLTCSWIDCPNPYAPHDMALRWMPAMWQRANHAPSFAWEMVRGTREPQEAQAEASQGGVSPLQAAQDADAGEGAADAAAPGVAED